MSCFQLLLPILNWRFQCVLYIVIDVMSPNIFRLETTNPGNILTIQFNVRIFPENEGWTL